MSSDELPEVTSRLGYQLKHAALKLEALHDRALAPFGINGRELGILLVIARGEQASQQRVAERLGVDRTTMVALLDALEAKGVVSRHPHPEDRRRNVVELSPAGTEALRRAVAASDAAERSLLSGLSADRARELRESLGEIAGSAQP
jgi:DNA-binding MarR family transcriptional regulator